MSWNFFVRKLLPSTPKNHWIDSKQKCQEGWKDWKSKRKAKSFSRWIFSALPSCRVPRKTRTVEVKFSDAFHPPLVYLNIFSALCIVTRERLQAFPCAMHFPLILFPPRSLKMHSHVKRRRMNAPFFGFLIATILFSFYLSAARSFYRIWRSFEH